jgi:molybdopterin-guanine dinucleotide biosynthesis protein A
MIDTVTGVVLAGGKSTRMGTNKALLVLNGETLVERCRETLSKIFKRVIISVNKEEPFQNLPEPKIMDRYQETGPLGGITSVLESGESRIFCVACDMPALNRELIDYMCRFTEYDAVIPLWNRRAEVLHAVYSGSLMATFQFALGENRFRITDALTQAKVRYVQMDEIKRFDPSGLSFRNINTPEDYNLLLRS